MSNQVMTPEFRVSFPYVFERGKGMDGKEGKYSVTMLFGDGADLSELKKAAAEVVKATWGDKPPSNIRSPFRDQADKADKDGYEPGRIFINATSKERPGLVDQSLNDIIDSSEFYAGCYARATVRAYAYDRNGNRGVAFGLQNIQKLRDGEPFSGRTKAADDFSPVEGGGTDPNDIFA